MISTMSTITREPAAESFNLEDLEARMEMLEGYWAEYIQRDFILQRSSDSLKERSYFKLNTFNIVLPDYLKAKAWFSRRIKALNLSASVPLGRSAPANVPSAQAALEKLRLPRFDGTQCNWEAFKEKFTSLIINEVNMDPVIKFQHLTNCLEGDAAEKLRGIKLIGANFDTAWDTLCKRYDNKYLRFSLQMQALVLLPTSSTESVKHLSQLLNTVNESVNTFTSLERPVTKWDDILVYFIESKLAVTTRLDWIQRLRGKNSIFPNIQISRHFWKIAFVRSILWEQIPSKIRNTKRAKLN